MQNPKHAFWKALIFTIIVFAIGLILGFFLEDSRSSSVQLILLNSEINLLDEQVRNRGLSQFAVDCKTSKESTFNFADDIYKEVLQLEEFDSSSKFTEELKIVHKKYDLLRMLLWLESIELKKRCNEDFHTVIYLFNYGEEDVQKKALQSSTGRLLADIKNKHGSNLLLIPIAANLDIKSIELAKQNYKIKETPALIVDESVVLEEIPPFDELENIIFQANNQ